MNSWLFCSSVSLAVKKIILWAIFFFRHCRVGTSDASSLIATPWRWWGSLGKNLCTQMGNYCFLAAASWDHVKAPVFLMLYPHQSIVSEVSIERIVPLG